MNRIEKWFSILAYLATAGLLIVAAIQLKEVVSANRVAEKAERITLTSAVLRRGLELERNYRSGGSDVRDIVSYYYQAFSYSQNDMLERNLWKPLQFSLCSFLKHDPRFQSYWRDVNKKFFAPDFVAQIASILKGEKC